MSKAVAHRGPDDHGFFDDGRPDVRVAFAHRRLSILDLSEAARQPMARGRVVITYNGEIYNYRELRAELEATGAAFRTQSDTEVVLAAYEAWGIAAVRRLRGIFAFALVDLDRGKVFLVRDHLGVKPLYVAKVRDRWVFASELKALAEVRDLRREPDREALRQYLRFLWIPGTRSGLAGVEKVPPASWLEIDLATGQRTSQVYWTPVAPELLEPTPRREEELVEELTAELRRVVREQLVSDVPVGAFLSGGLDSSLVVAAMCGAGVTSPRTYSIGYRAEDLAYDIVPDDLPYARKVSQHFGTQSHEIVLSPDVASLLPTVVDALDEPIGDPAALSSYLICQAAKTSSSVMLGGVGADELFGGYPRQRALLYGSVLRRLPPLMKSTARSLVRRLPGAGRGPLAKLGRAGQKLTASLGGDALDHYISMETYFSRDMQDDLVADPGPLGGLDRGEPERIAAEVRAATSDPLRQAMLWDLLTYLPNLNLAYTDRTSMAHAVEVRVPFLDVRLVEWSLRLRARQLIHVRRGRLEGKWLLKQAAERFLPADIVWRKKAGFGAPVRSWLRVQLADMREELLEAVVRRGWFEGRFVRSLQEAFLSGRRDYALQIWMLISLELWARRFLDQA